MTAENEFKTSTSQRLRFLCCPTVTLSSCNLPHITVLASVSPALIRIQANKPLLTHRFQWYICYPTVIPKPSIWWAIFQRFVPFGTHSSRRRLSINQSPRSSLNGHRKQEYYELQGRDEWTFFVTNIPKKLREKLAHESLLSWLYNYLTNIASKNTVRIRHSLLSSRPVWL